MLFIWSCSVLSAYRRSHMMQASPEEWVLGCAIANCFCLLPCILWMIFGLLTLSMTNDECNQVGLNRSLRLHLRPRLLQTLVCCRALSLTITKKNYIKKF